MVLFCARCLLFCAWAGPSDGVRITPLYPVGRAPQNPNTASAGSRKSLLNLKKLVAFADDPNLPNEKDGRTPIQLAASRGNSRVIEILAPLVKNPNAPFDQGLTPIQVAAEKGYEEYARLKSETFALVHRRYSYASQICN